MQVCTCHTHAEQGLGQAYTAPPASSAIFPPPNSHKWEFSPRSSKRGALLDHPTRTEPTLPPKPHLHPSFRYLPATSTAWTSHTGGTPRHASVMGYERANQEVPQHIIITQMNVAYCCDTNEQKRVQHGCLLRGGRQIRTPRPKNAGGSRSQ